ncbi:MAG TPA: DUF58 domain-containing protein [Steroidobacteraceae bacterium]|jgi:uncharacterized protein (DUF58 family)|nr:DUF58 domain-containing protein [Steroidobacteraceae bacterium]
MRAFMQRRMAAWIRARQGTDLLPVTLQRRRLYILPTRAGVAFGALLLLMLIAGLNYANSLALLVTFLLAGMALVAMHGCHRNLLGLTVADLSALDSFAGEHAELRLRLANGSAQPRIGIEIDAAGVAPVACSAPAGGEVVVHLRIATPRRGALPVAALRILSTWPFGLFRAWTWLHVPQTITVYPRPAGQRPAPITGGSHTGTAPRETGDIDEWATLRAFRDGDSPRQVAWKAYARGAPLLVKEYTASGNAERLFDYAALEGLDTEQRLSQLARWIVNCTADGDGFGLRLPQQLIELDQGAVHRQRCLRALALFENESAAT